MAYKSQVTNKYMGATFKGAPKSNTVTELGQIVTALKNDFNPAFKNYVDTYEGKLMDGTKIFMICFKRLQKETYPNFMMEYFYS